MLKQLTQTLVWVQDQEGGPFARRDKLAKLAFVF